MWSSLPPVDWRCYVPEYELGDDPYVYHDGSGRELSLIDSSGSYTVLESRHVGDMVGERVVSNECFDEPAAAHFGMLTMTVDSGCTIHMVQAKFIRDLYDVRRHRAEIMVADGRKLVSSHIGRIKRTAHTKVSVAVVPQKARQWP